MQNELLTDDTKVIALLCGYFGKKCAVKPLTQSEYSRLARWLWVEKMRPKDLLQKENLPAAATAVEISGQRLEELLNRGVQLGFAVEEWQRNGIWLISRSDFDYPWRYKKHLKDKAPPLLFGVGDRALLNGGGLAIVGSRNIDEEGIIFTRRAAEICAANKMPVVSGGARGADITAMNAALAAGGMVIGVLADSLFKKSLEKNNRNAIADGKLLLISACHPEAPFTVGSAMARNKLIYSLADYSLVVSAEYNKGGTWAGAKEELQREQPLPIFVRQGLNLPSGNKKLLEQGAVPWPLNADEADLAKQLAELLSAICEQKDQLSILDLPEEAERALAEDNVVVKDSAAIDLCSDGTVYDTVLPLMLKYMEEPITAEELAVKLDILKTQLNIWLKKAAAENKIRKLSRPLRYQKIPQ